MDKQILFISLLIKNNKYKEMVANEVSIPLNASID